MALSDAKLRGLRATGRRFELPDRDGLVLRVGANGSMTWCVTFAVRRTGHRKSKDATEGGTGKRRRATIGLYPAMGLAEARQQASSITGQARSGVEPFPEPVADPVPPPGLTTTVAELLAAYGRDHLDRNLQSGENVKLLLRRHVIPRWGQRPIGELGPGDLIALLEDIRQPGGALVTLPVQERAYAAVRGGPGAAIEVRKWTRAMFQHAAATGLLPGNPFADVRNRNRLRPRDRVLSMREIATVWHAAGAMLYPWSALFRLLLLTGSRRNEWADAEAAWIDGDATRLEVPATAYKTGRTHVVPFSVQVRSLVQGLPKPLFGPYLLSTSGGGQAVSGFSKAKAQLDDIIAGRTAMAPWVLHDLRRSMATHMERLGVTPHVVEACLGHALKGVAGTYRHYAYLEEKRAALQLWADEVDSTIAPALVAA